MKNTILLSVLAFTCIISHAQTVTSLHENFDVDCVLAGEISYSSTKWLTVTNTTPDIPLGQWTCTPISGRPNASGNPTPGIMCSDYFAGQFHLDTSFLITPLLNLSGYISDSIYLQFDTKMSNLYLGANLNVFLQEDSTLAAFSPVATDSNLGFLMTPKLGIIDSGKWVTHQVNLTGLKSVPFYIAFMYVTASNTGSTWYLDNVNISTTRLGVPTISEKTQPLTVFGMPGENHIELSYYSEGGGDYQIGLTDMLGRRVYLEQRALTAGSQTINIDGLGLRPGMYFIKISNGAESEVAKVVIR